MTEDWKDSVDKESLEKAISAGEILPELPLPTIQEGDKVSKDNITVKFINEPRVVENAKLPQGKAFFADVEYNGEKRSIVVPGSLKFNLLKEMKLNNLDGLVGNTFIIGAQLAETKFNKESKVYWAQYKKTSNSAEEKPVSGGEPAE